MDRLSTNIDIKSENNYDIWIVGIIVIAITISITAYLKIQSKP